MSTNNSVVYEDGRFSVDTRYGVVQLTPGYYQGSKNPVVVVAGNGKMFLLSVYCNRIFTYEDLIEDLEAAFAVGDWDLAADSRTGARISQYEPNKFCFGLGDDPLMYVEVLEGDNDKFETPVGVDDTTTITSYRGLNMRFSTDSFTEEEINFFIPTVVNTFHHLYRIPSHKTVAVKGSIRDRLEHQVPAQH